MKIVTLPAEDDPDTFARKHSLEELKQYLQTKAIDFIVFKTRAMSEEAMHDPIKKSQLIKEIVSTIAVIPERITRSVYVKECSRLMELEEDVLWSEMKVIRRQVIDENGSRTQAQNNNTVKQPLVENGNYDLFSSVPQEKEVLRVLIKYGDRDATFLGESEDGEEPEKIVMKVADFIIQSMREDDFAFESAVCDRMYQEYCAFFDKQLPINEDYYLRHEDQEIGQMAMTLLTDLYTASNWERRSIGIKNEADDLGRTTEKAVYALKSRKIEIMIRDVSENIKRPLNDDELMGMMERKRRLDSAKRMFKNKLGRVM